MTKVNRTEGNSEASPDVSNYDGIEEVAQVQPLLKVRENDVSLSDVSGQVQQVARKLDNNQSFSDSSPERSPKLSHRPSKGYYPNVEAALQAPKKSSHLDLDLEYETFNGSVADFADSEDHQSQNNGDNIWVRSQNSVYSNSKDGSITANTSAALPSRGNHENLQIKVAKRSSKHKDEIVTDFSKIKSYRKISAGIKPKEKDETLKEEDRKLQNLADELKRLTIQISKLRREIEVVDELTPETYQGSPLAQSMDYKKLKFARGKLNDKREVLKKKRYELEIKMNNKLKHIYGSTDSDRAQYWAAKTMNL